jgi:hypothetical protein
VSADWIAVEIDLRDKPEVWAIAEALGLDPDAVVGKLIRVWGWFDKQTTDGHARRVTFSVLNDKAGVTGFAEAMQAEGWLVKADGAIVMPKFELKHGASGKARLLGTRRKQAQRAREAVAGDDEKPPGDARPRPAKVTRVSRSKRDKNTTTEQNTLSKSDASHLVDSDESTCSPFERFWAVYPLKEAKIPAQKKWASKQLDRLVEVIVADVKRRKAEHGKWLDGYIPMPPAYLNQERWNDPINPLREAQRKAPDPKGGKLTQAIAGMFDGDSLPNADHPNAPRLPHD